MKIEQMYTGCLAEAAYYIESEGEVAIIDPLRETEPYLAKAKRNDASIKYIFETHFHADFVSGHIDLAKKSGAKIVYGPKAEANFDFVSAKDGQTFNLGKITIKVLHTPGHTQESTTYLLLDEEGKEHAIFTGDTLFIGDVGRPDLAVKSDLTQEDLAGMLYDSLRNKIMPLPDSVTVYPAHGAGSACGKNMSKETFDTLGNQKQSNYALRDISKEQFIAEVTEGLAPPPQYFPKNALLNKLGYDSIDHIIQQGTTGLDVDSFTKILNEQNALVLDTRSPKSFVAGFIPGSLFVGIDGSFATWIGTLIEDLKQPILVIADEGREEEVVTRLARVGYDNSLGYLKGGIEAWKEAGKAIDTIDSVSPDTFVEAYENGDAKVLDVRKESEFDNGHLDKAANEPLDFIQHNFERVEKDEPQYVHCAGGYRSVIFASLLKAKGFNNLINVEGGWGAISKSSIDKKHIVTPELA